jgi:aminopeptidase
MMLTAIHLERYADILLWGLKTARRQSFNKEDIVLVRAHLGARGLAEILHAKLLSMGLNPIVQFVPTPTMEKHFFKLTNSRQLRFLPPGEDALYRSLNGSIFLHAPESITHLRGTDPGKIGRHAVARKPLKDILDQRDAAGLFGWTLCMLPTEALAQQADIHLNEYTEQIIKACWLHRREPVAIWQQIHKDAQAVKKWLNSLPIDRLHIQSQHIDLWVKPGTQRRWLGLSGHNIPSFEIFLSPDWRGTEGIYWANLPSYRSGNLVDQVRLTFRKGRAVKIGARQGQSFVQRQLNMDPGACRLGEFSLTDKRFSKINRFMANTLFDENFGGTQGNCHIALGSSYADAYNGDPARLTPSLKKQLGFNDSALHWDLVNTEKKQVVARLADGREMVIYENGCFAY